MPRSRWGGLDVRWAWVLLSSAFLFAVLPWLLKRQGWTTSLSDGIYIGTGIAVVWYTVETYYLRREMVRTNEIAVLPLVVVGVEQVPVPGVAVGATFARKVILRNIGKGPALFVQLTGITFGPMPNVGTLAARFSPTTASRWR